MGRLGLVLALILLGTLSELLRAQHTCITPPC